MSKKYYACMKSQLFCRVAIAVLIYGACIHSVQAQEDTMTTTLNELKNLLNDGSVRDDLELTAEQNMQLKPLLRDMLIKFSDLQRELDRSTTDDEKKAVSEKLNQAFVSAKSTLSEILLPHQLARLNQIYQQKKIEPLRDTTFGLNKLNEELELTAAQVREIEKVSEKNDRIFQERIHEMRAEIIELRRKMRKEVLDILSDKQKNHYEQMIGDEFLKAFWVAHWFTTNPNERLLRGGKNGRTNR